MSKPDTKHRFYTRNLLWVFLLIIGTSVFHDALAHVNDTLASHFDTRTSLLILFLALLIGWLSYRLLKSRLEILNRSAFDFHGLADNAHDGIFIVQHGQLVYANQRAGDILGYTNEELLGLRLKDVVHPDEAEKIFDIHQRRIQGEDVPKQYEAAFINKSHAIIPVELSAAVTTWQGSPAGLVIIRDITDRQLIEQTLMDSEKRYRSLVENSPDAILIIDAESNSIIEANEQTERLFKLNKQQLFATELEQLSQTTQDSKQQKPLVDYLQRALHGLPLIFEHTLVDSTGLSISCEIRLSRMPFPNRRLIRASIIDITRRKLYQNALKASELRLQQFFQASFESLFFHENGIITDVNDIVEKMFGYQRDEVIGHHVLEYVAPETLALAKQNMMQGLEGPYELMAIRKDGSVFPVQIQAKNLQNNSTVQRIVSVTDISRLQQANTKLLTSEKQLKNILDNMIDSFYSTDLEGNINQASPSMEKLLGYNADELISMNLSILYADPYIAQFFLDSLKTANGKLQSYEALLKCKNGDKVWVSTNALYAVDPENNLTNIVCVSHDISAQHLHEIELQRLNDELETKVEKRTRQLSDKIAELEHMQETLSESENSFRILVENAVDSFLLYDLQGNIVDVNRHACKSLGYSREELLQLNIADIEQAPNPISFSDMAMRLQNQGSLQLTEIHQRKDGSQCPVEVNLALLEKDKTQLILALARDISKRPASQHQPTAKPTTKKPVELS